ncbi:MAG: hypothetical protein WC004_03000 [Candidatus Absconditabacterales bacterium]
MMKKADFDNQKELLNNQITQLQEHGVGFLDIFSLRMQLSRCIMASDLQKLQQSIDAKKELIQQLLGVA